MDLSLEKILPHLIYSFRSEYELVKAIEEISHNFTKSREKISVYLNDPKLVSAYTAFYFLTNIPKLREVMKWLPSEWMEELKNCDFIDLGAGPGTFSIAWKLEGASGPFYQIELSELMKEQGRKLWNGLFQDKLYQGNRWEWKTERPKFLLFGHSANEMKLETVIKYIEDINPDHILFIEPGTKEFFPKMLEIRDYLLNHKFHVLYPCPKPLPCPMRNGEDWCHQFIQVKQSDEVERLSQMARKDRKLLPLTVQAFSRSFSMTNPEERLVRVFPETKFSHEWEVCHNNHLERYQIMKRDLSKQDSKYIGTILAGESIKTELVKEVSDTKRVKLKL